MPHTSNIEQYNYIYFLLSYILYLLTKMITHMTQHVAAWTNTHERVLQSLGLHTDDSYIPFLRWFCPQTRLTNTTVTDPQPCIMMT
jgi:hypothetical protein